MPEAMEAEIRITAEGASWLASLEAQGGDHVRVGLMPGDRGDLPSWSAGTRLDCALGDGEDSIFAEAVVIAQDGARAWLAIPPVWDRVERRSHVRLSVGFPVFFQIEGQPVQATCVDVSAGGIRALCPVPLVRGMRVELTFRLPGDERQIDVDATVLHAEPSVSDGVAVEAGFKLHVSPAEGLRMAAFCQRTALAA